MHGIDAPEIGQAFGTVSRDGLRALVLRKSVTMHGQERDRYGGVLGRLEVEGQDVTGRWWPRGWRGTSRGTATTPRSRMPRAKPELLAVAYGLTAIRCRRWSGGPQRKRAEAKAGAAVEC